MNELFALDLKQMLPTVSASKRGDESRRLRKICDRKPLILIRVVKPECGNPLGSSAELQAGFAIIRNKIRLRR
jgi:hypothetical protein